VPKLGSLRGQPLPVRAPLIVLEDGALREIGVARPQDTVTPGAPLLAVDQLTTRFDVGHDLLGRVTHRVHAVEEVSFEIRPGETLALVGESGSGKSTVGKTLQQLVKATSGSIRFDGSELASMPQDERQRLRREIQYIFQDPYASLDPRKTVGFSIAEPIRTHKLLDNHQAIQRRVAELLEHVGLKPEHMHRYPHEFSGGQRQRICIARALASEPTPRDRRRIGVGARRVGAGPDHRLADGAAGGAPPVLPFHHPRHGGGGEIAHRVAVMYWARSSRSAAARHLRAAAAPYTASCWRGAGGRTRPRHRRAADRGARFPAPCARRATTR
jgi:ABC-type lipoprotein export system ATPase subunit